MTRISEAEGAQKTPSIQVMEEEFLSGLLPDPADKTRRRPQGMEEAMQGVVGRNKLHGRQKSISTKR